MRKILLSLTLIVVSAFVSFNVIAGCGSYFQPESPADTFSGSCAAGGFSKTSHWRLFFVDGHETHNLEVSAPGICSTGGPPNACYPGFDTPYWMESTVGKWNQVTRQATVAFGPDAVKHCVYNSPVTTDHIFTYNCKARCRGTTDFANFASGCIGGFTSNGGTCGRNQTFVNKCFQYGEGFNDENCSCEAVTPILIDINGDGFALTDAAHGVSFDLEAKGVLQQYAWTTPESDDAFLVLDRNGNGTIDDGKELFGNATTQAAAPEGEQHNGFLALALLDSPGSGGNGDGKISKLDSVFESLRLWQDQNHNGVSESHELHGLKELGLKSIGVDYKTSKKVDEHGNRFRYRAKVKDANDAQLGRWAWDVVLKAN